jgi:hypothetical protein
VGAHGRIGTGNERDSLNGGFLGPDVRQGRSKEEKVRIGRPSAPRWELDIAGYSSRENTLRVVECKSYLAMIEHRPDDRNLPNFLTQVERIIGWRAAVPVEDRFWKKE